MKTVPLRPFPNQILQTVLGGQNCSLRLYTRDTPDGERLFCDLAVDQEPVFYGSICRDAVGLKRYDWLVFTGELLFIDMQGDADPHWSGLGDRWRLIWLDTVEAARFEEGTL